MRDIFMTIPVVKTAAESDEAGFLMHYNIDLIEKH